MYSPDLKKSSFHVVIIWQRFLPYHLARLQHLAQLLVEKGHRLSALEVASRDAAYDAVTEVSGQSSFETIFPDRNYHDINSREIYEAVRSRLNELHPDAVFAPATAFPEGMGAARYRLSGKGLCFLMDDAWEHTDHTGWLTRRVKQLIHRSLDGAFIPALSHASYYQSLGFSADRLVYGVDVVDNAWFARHAQGGKTEPSETSTNRPHFLFVGRFLPRKGVKTLLTAYKAYRSQAENPWDLVLIGGGSEEALIKRQSLEIDGVRFAGVQTGHALCHCYGRAKALVVPSESDPWALVVNEGMAAGLPVLVSRGCGCARTLVCEGENGWSFAPGDVDELVSRMLELTQLPDAELKAMGQRSREIIADWGLDRFAQGVFQALEIPKRPDAGFLSNLAVRLWPGRVRVN